jgi:hypothetical protein
LVDVLFRPCQGLDSFCLITQGGRSFHSLALGYFRAALRALNLSGEFRDDEDAYSPYVFSALKLVDRIGKYGEI